MSGRNLVKKNKGIIKVGVMFFSIFPQAILRAFLNWTRGTPGLLGMGIRYMLVKNLFSSCGNNVSISQGVFLRGVGNISTGDNVSIHPMCYIDGTGGLNIGDNVSVAHASSILTTNHAWDDMGIPIKYNKVTYEPVTIESDVWIGCGCRILAGIHIASRSVIAAGAVVSKNVEPNVIVGGVPAKVIKRM